jgi:hypothetical protein
MQGVRRERGKTKRLEENSKRRSADAIKKRDRTKKNERS